MLSASGSRRCHKCSSTKLPYYEDNAAAEYCECGTGCKESEDDFLFPAQLPWFKPEISDLDAKIEDTKFFKHLMEFGKKEAGKFNLQLYKILAYSFPQYLPIGFHSMDSKAYVDNIDESLKAASHFVLANYMNSSPVYHERIQELCEDHNEEDHAIFMKSCLLNYLKRVQKNANLLPESSMSAKDFLLEPWIIIQLPFQPGLLHQWMVAVLAEYCKYHDQLAEFACLLVRREVKKVVEGLFQIGHQVLATITCCWQELNRFPCESTASKRSTSFDDAINGLFFDPNLGIIKNLPALEFIMSEKCTNMLRALKRMAWSAPAKWETCRGSLYQTATDMLEFLNILYSIHFWKRGYTSDLLGGTKKTGAMTGKLSEVPLDEHEEAEVSRDEIRSFIEEEIIKPGRVTGLSTEQVMKSLTNTLFNSFVHFYKQFRFGKESAKGIRLEDSGVMMNLINLQCQLQASVFRTVLCSIIISANQHKNVLYHSVNNEGGPNFTLAQIHRAISKALSSKKWTVENIINKVKVQCPVPETFQMPDVSMLGVEKVASIFEARLKHTVFKMLESQYGLIRRKETRKFYPELLLIQYMLPRFVGLLLYMDKENKLLGKTGEDERIKRYVYFFHNLLKCYEVDKCYKPLASVPESFHGRLLLQTGFNAVQVQIGYARVELATLFPNEYSIPHEIYSCCLEVMNTCNEHHCINEIVHSAILEWNVHFYQFVTKILHSLQLTSEHFGQSGPIECLMLLRFSTLDRIAGLALNMSARGSAIEDHLFQVKSIFKIKSHQFFIPSPCTTIGSQMEEEAKTLSQEQLAGLLVYLAFQKIPDHLKQLAKSAFLSFVPFDILETIFYAFVQGDSWRVKQTLSVWLNSSDNRDDLSLVTLDFAKAHPALYGPVLQDLHRGWNWEKGEITFFPIMHCRWCGKVDCSDFRICRECRDSDDYPDMNFFCSEKCEKEALVDIHLEEHARFVIEKCKF